MKVYDSITKLNAYAHSSSSTSMVGSFMVNESEIIAVWGRILENA